RRPGGWYLIGIQYVGPPSCSASPHADIDRRGVAEVPAARYQHRPRCQFAHKLRRAVRGGIVDDDHIGAVHALERIGQCIQERVHNVCGVVGDGDDDDVGRTVVRRIECLWSRDLVVHHRAVLPRARFSRRGSARTLRRHPWYTRRSNEAAWSSIALCTCCSVQSATVRTLLAWADSGSRSARSASVWISVWGERGSSMWSSATNG